MKIHRLSGTAPPILALHGFTGSGLDFEALAPHIPTAILAPDLPGHGQTPPASMAAAVDALAPLAEGRVVLGYSMGGRTALQVACAVPVRALVLIGASPGIADPAARQERREADERLAEHIEAVGVAAFSAEWSRKPIIATQQRIPQPWRGRMEARKQDNTAAGLAGSLRGMGTGAMASVWERLPAIPTLLVVGECDGKFCDIADSMVIKMSDAEVFRVPGVGHCAHLEAPERTARRIVEFLRRVG